MACLKASLHVEDELAHLLALAIILLMRMVHGDAVLNGSKDSIVRCYHTFAMLDPAEAFLFSAVRRDALQVRFGACPTPAAHFKSILYLILYTYTLYLYI